MGKRVDQLLRDYLVECKEDWLDRKGADMSALLLSLPKIFM